MTSVNPFAGHELRPPRLTAAEAAAAARRCFGVEGELHPLASHQDQNFLVDTPAGRFVLKVASEAIRFAELELQNRAMEHVAARLPGAVPQPVRARDGHDVAEAAGHRVRLVTYLEGEPLRDFGHLAGPVLRGAGRLVGKIAAALRSFEHPAADRVLQWDVRHAGAVTAAFTPAVPEAGRRELAQRAMERAAASLEHMTPELRLRVIHGDPTDWNLLARLDPAGRPLPSSLVDFGDVMRSWLAAECAVLATSVCARDPARALQDAVEVVRGFHAALPLTEPELVALPALMVARAVVSALGGEHQRAVDPANAYVARGAEIAWRNLTALTAIPPPLARAAFRQACGLRERRMRSASLHVAPRKLAAELERRRPTPIDLSAETDAFRAGAWRDGAALARIVERLDRFGRSEDLFSSVGGSLVSCEVGLAVLDVLEEERLQDNARQVGDHVTERLGVLVGEFPIARALHGIGLYRGLELGHEDGRPATEAARAICERMLGLGVIVQPTGPDGNVLKLKPPLCFTAQDVDLLAATLGETLAGGW